MKKLIKSFVIVSLLSTVALLAYNPLDGTKAQKVEALKYVKNSQGGRCAMQAARRRASGASHRGG